MTAVPTMQECMNLNTQIFQELSRGKTLPVPMMMTINMKLGLALDRAAIAHEMAEKIANNNDLSLLERSKQLSGLIAEVRQLQIDLYIAHEKALAFLVAQ